MFLRRSCRSSPIRSFCTVSLAMASLSRTCSFPNIRRLLQLVCRRLMSLSPNQLSTSLPLDVRCDMMARFFSDVLSFDSSSSSLFSQVLLTPVICSFIFSTVSPKRTSYINSTVLFSFSLLFWADIYDPFSARRLATQWECCYCCLLISFRASFMPARSAVIIVVLSIRGTSFIMKFQSSFSLTINLLSRLLCLSSQQRTICSNLTFIDCSWNYSEFDPFGQLSLDGVFLRFLSSGVNTYSRGISCLSRECIRGGWLVGMAEGALISAGSCLLDCVGTGRESSLSKRRRLATFWLLLLPKDINMKNVDQND